MDDIVGLPGFGEALSTVGWAVHDEENNCVILPNFNEYNTSGEVRSAAAKTNAQRQREFRERQKLRESNVTRNVTNNITSNRKEEKRREDIKPERESACEAFTPPDENNPPMDFQPGAMAGYPPMGKFPITSDWMPQPEFARRATLWGRNLGTEPGYTAEELQQFRDYWSCDGRVRHQQQWEMAFADSLLQSRARIQRSKPAGGRDPNRVSEPDKTIPDGFRGQP